MSLYVHPPPSGTILVPSAQWKKIGSARILEVWVKLPCNKDDIE